MNTVNIPRLDLNNYINGDAAARKKFSEDIGKAFNETGFVTITNHGLSKQLIDELYAQVKALFALPDSVKQKYEIPELAGQRGYTGKGKETAKGFKTPDLKEFWQIGQTVTDGGVSKEDYPDNLVVEELPKFNEVTLEVYKKPEGYKLVLDRAQFILTPKKENSLQPLLINEFDHTVHYGAYRLTLLHDDSPLIIKYNPMAVAIDAALLVYPLTVRAWQQSDYFYPLGMKTRKKLSDFFINRKIALHEKTEIPILVNGNGDIIWIGGHRPDERYKVTNNTKKVTIFELFKL